MGIVAFHWENKQLTLLHNRDNFDYWRIKAADWDKKEEILSGWIEQLGGTWCGISKSGRVAFLVDSDSFSNGLNRCLNSAKLPAEFLATSWSPAEFASMVAKRDSFNTGLAYNLIVADITSNTMSYISKPLAKKKNVHTENVGFGVHILSLAGLDAKSPKDLRLRHHFMEMLIGDYKNKPLKEIATRLMYDPNEAVKGDKLSAIFVDSMIQINRGEKRRYRTTCTTALTVNPDKEVKFFEGYLMISGQWKEHDFTFQLD
ncbi:hypothetical protein EUTSA_v10021358mg [Eutrema salsugineum]|uniref:Uncharacterized protein n=1 Tax=Eutrema salsugineum TaxID=72664 RepID=V4M9P1_EUTSA|nr:uncharacterized protein LOC18023855 [Eutrema salsugineum]ESQ49108.1 hypothetical protein EUTSA_v10021358mg [Eutrema salsugineum]